MAFTEPRTWTDTEFVDDDIMNAHIRDNFRAMGPHLLARKTADETDSVGTMQDDDHLITPTIGANETWQLEWHLWVINTSGSFAVRFTFPSGTFAGTISGITGDRMVSGTVSPTAEGGVDSNNVTAGVIHAVKAVFACGGTGGVVTLQWRRLTSGSATVKANSTLWGVKLA